MEFDNNKVLTPFTENKEKWIGWRGFGCDSVATLKHYVRNYPGVTIDLHCLSDINDEDDIAVCNYPYRLVNVDFRYFYPIEPPAEKPTYRPCKSLEELAASANGGFPVLSNTDDEKLKQCDIFLKLKGRPVCDKDRGYIEVIDALDFSEVAVDTRIHLSCYTWLSFDVLFGNFEWADKKGDARVIGVKENEV